MKMLKEYEFSAGTFHVDCGTCFITWTNRQLKEKGDYFTAFKTVKLNREWCERVARSRVPEAA